MRSLLQELQGRLVVVRRAAFVRNVFPRTFNGGKTTPFGINSSPRWCRVTFQGEEAADGASAFEPKPFLFRRQSGRANPNAKRKMISGDAVQSEATRPGAKGRRGKEREQQGQARAWEPPVPPPATVPLGLGGRPRLGAVPTGLCVFASRVITAPDDSRSRFPPPHVRLLFLSETSAKGQSQTHLG